MLDVSLPARDDAIIDVSAWSRSCRADATGMRYVYGGYALRVQDYGQELPAAKSAGARYGVQGTFAVNGIDTLDRFRALGGAAFGSPLPYLEGPSSSHAPPLSPALDC